jgi:hypothetical protein
MKTDVFVGALIPAPEQRQRHFFDKKALVVYQVPESLHSVQ